jgi:hypothetical protein
VRIVAGENQILLADRLADIADICFVAFTAITHWRRNYFIGLHRQQRRVIFRELLPVPVHALQLRIRASLMARVPAGKQRGAKKTLGFSWQKSSSRFLYARQIASASNGSMSGTATSLPSTSTVPIRKTRLPHWPMLQDYPDGPYGRHFR